MPIPTPFYSRTGPLNQALEWRNWSGYIAASVYEPSHEREYYAVRNSAALFDVSPLYKYDVKGPDALALVNRVVTRDLSKCAVGQIMYTPWCDDDGKLVDDGTVWRLAGDHFRITSAERNLRWFQDAGLGLDASVSDISSDLAALSLQGPESRAILKQAISGIDFDNLRPFRLAHGQVEGRPITVTRTGYTGDLGYELWIAPEQAEPLWDQLINTGQNYCLIPAGMLALDLVRIEAGLLLIEIDYIPATHAVIEAQKSSPFDAGLGWAVALDKGPFIGREALLVEQARGSRWLFTGLRVLWEDIEALYAALGLQPQLAGRASRASIPVYRDGRQIGQATSHAYSPLLKEYIGLASLRRDSGVEIGDIVDVEMTVEFTRHTARAEVVKLPFFNPERRRS